MNSEYTSDNNFENNLENSLRSGEEINKMKQRTRDWKLIKKDRQVVRPLVCNKENCEETKDCFEV